MKVKNALLGFILWITVISIIFLGSILASLPMWIVGILGLIAWGWWLLLEFRDAERDKRALNNPAIWMITRDSSGTQVWTAMDGSGRTRPINQRPENQPLFDQDGQEV